MPDITIVKLKIRRGTDSQRKTIVLEQGELGYATDTRRVFVGDGITIGGVPVSNINHPPISNPNNLINQRAVINDFIYAGTYLYQLTAADYTSLDSWTRISNNLLADGVSLDYDTRNGVDFIKIKDGGITGKMFNSSAAYSLGGLSATSNGLVANVDGSTLTVTNNNMLSVYSIDQRHVSSSSFTRGISGGSGEQIGLNVDENYFTFTVDDKLAIASIPNGSVNFYTLDLNVFGDGLYSDGDRIVTSVKGPGDGLEDNGYGYIGIKNTVAPGNSFFRSLEYNSKGQILSADYTISTTLSCDTSSPALAIFNGSPSQTVFGTPYTNQALITVLSANSFNPQVTEQITLSSAGFIGFESTNAKDGMPVGRFAIPIFTY